MENLIWGLVVTIMMVVFVYKATKIGLIDDAINFVKYEILKRKRP